MDDLTPSAHLYRGHVPATSARAQSAQSRSTHDTCRRRVDELTPLPFQEDSSPTHGLKGFRRHSRERGKSAEMLWDEKLWGGLVSVAQRGKSLHRVWGGRRGEVAGGKRPVGGEGRHKAGGEESVWLGQRGQKEDGKFFHSNRKEKYSWPFVFAGFASTDVTNHENSIFDLWPGIQMRGPPVCIV